MMLIEKYFVGIIDGKKTTNINSFLIEIGKSFYFPDYYGFTMNSMLECLNDLSWIKAEGFILKIENFSKFLSEESLKERESIINILDDVSLEWKQVPNYEGEESFRKKTDFKILKEE